MSGIPDLANIQPFETDYSQRIDSEINDPVVINDTGGSQGGGFARFTLTNKGFLSSDSALMVGIKNNSNSDIGFFAPHIGANQLIHTVVLKFGAKVVSEIREFSSFSAYKSMFNSPTENFEKNQYLTGQMYNLSEVYQYDKNIVDENNKATSLSLNNGCPLTTSNPTQIQHYRGHQRSTYESVYALKLFELFPFFSQSKQFPLLMCKEEINIEIHFNKYPFNTNRITGGAAANARPSYINTSEIKLCADYIFMDAELMTAYANDPQNKEYQWDYLDYRLSQQTITATGSADAAGQYGGIITKNVRNVGGAGLMCNKVIMGLEDIGVYTTKGGSTADEKSNDIYRLSSLSILNKFRSMRTRSSDIKDSNFIWNVRYNDSYLYPIDRVNDSLLMDDIYQAEGKVFRVNKGHYSKQDKATVEKNWLSNVSNENHNLSGQLFWVCAKLDGSRVNSNGIDVEFENTSIDNNQYANYTSRSKVYTQNCWLELQRHAILKDGRVECYYK